MERSERKRAWWARHKLVVRGERCSSRTGREKGSKAERARQRETSSQTASGQPDGQARQTNSSQTSQPARRQFTAGRQESKLETTPAPGKDGARRGEVCACACVCVSLCA